MKDRELISQLLPSYLLARKIDLKRLGQAIERRDFSAIVKVGHRLKGNSATFGFSQIGLLGGKIEKYGRKNDFLKCQEYYKKIEGLIQR